MNKQDRMNQRYLENYLCMARALTAAANAATKTVNIEIEPTRMKFMKDNHYKLCFAKKVGDFDYNVVWQSFDDEQYYQYNEFSWEPKYQIFGTKTYKANAKIKVTTNVSNIGLGQTCTLDESGRMSKAVDGGVKTALNMINQNSDIHVGINQLAIDGEGNQVSTPIYLSADFVVLGDISLTPKESVLIWFQANIETSTIFTTARSMSKELDLTFADEASVRYNAKGVWEEI